MKNDTITQPFTKSGRTKLATAASSAILTAVLAVIAAILLSGTASFASASSAIQGDYIEWASAPKASGDGYSSNEVVFKTPTNNSMPKDDSSSVSETPRMPILPIVENWRYWLCLAGCIICILLVFRVIIRLHFYDGRRYPENLRRYLESPVFPTRKRHIYEEADLESKENSSDYKNTYDTFISFFDDGYEEQYVIDSDEDFAAADDLTISTPTPTELPAKMTEQARSKRQAEVGKHKIKEAKPKFAEDTENKPEKLKPAIPMWARKSAIQKDENKPAWAKDDNNDDSRYAVYF